jgi:ABC-type transporter Mla maintaining outer membrane lipid asymmetry ATPase subunit MlaF
MIDDGRIVFAGTPEELQRSVVPVVRQFVDAARFDRDTSEKHNIDAGVEGP